MSEASARRDRRSASILSQPFSLYLDVVRFAAALVVALSHVWRMVFPAHPLPWPGHDAVVVFFVLSGLVVAHAASDGRPATVYVQHRLARLWSVTLPAIALSAIAAALIPGDVAIDAAPPPLEHWAAIWWPALLNTLFLAQSWSLDVVPPYDSPFWSLSFEAWYYVLFGIWTYAAPRGRLMWTGLGAIVAGPKILLLLPIWLMGVAIYRARIRLSTRWAAALFAISIVAGLAFFRLDLSIGIRNAMTRAMPALMGQLHGANQFVGDTLLGLIVSLNFVAAANLAPWLARLQPISRPCRTAASFTFSLYLYHMPAFALLWGFLGLRSAWTVLPALALCIVGLGLVTERQLPRWRAWAATVASWLAVTPRAARGPAGVGD